MKKLLSICIPTYNRAEFLPDAIESILNQITSDIKDKVEICISDNASTDNTEEVIKKYQEKNICDIVYHKNKENIGADRNFLKVIEIANGEYCWWLGSDDALESDILNELVSKIENTKIEFYLLTQNCYDKALKNTIPCNKHPLLDENDKLLILNNLLNESIYLLGYISVLIVKKDLFLKKTPNEGKYIGSMYIHLYKILYLLNKNYKMYFIRKPIVKWRADNDSFLNDLKLYGRIKIDIDGYSSIAKDVFGEDSLEYKKVIQIRVFDKMLRNILLLKLNGLNRNKILELYEDFKDNMFYYNLAKVLSLVPKEFVYFMKYMYRKTFKRY